MLTADTSRVRQPDIGREYSTSGQVNGGEESGAYSKLRIEGGMSEPSLTSPSQMDIPLTELHVWADRLGKPADPRCAPKGLVPTAARPTSRHPASSRSTRCRRRPRGPGRRAPPAGLRRAR